MGDARKVQVAILNRAGPGSTPQKTLALVSKMSDSKGDLGSGLASAEESDTTLPEIRYSTSIQHFPTLIFVTFPLRLLGELYYLLCANDYDMASKVAIDPGKPSLVRIRGLIFRWPQCHIVRPPSNDAFRER